MDFFEVIKTRRSVRKYTNKKVPNEVIEKAIDAALLAPNSSNMQTWEFYWVKDQNKKNDLIKACLSQTAAQTAQELIVIVANPHLWKQNAKDIAAILEKQNSPSKVIDYYRKLMPAIYGFQFLAPLKWIMVNSLGLFKPTPRGWSPGYRTEVCIKSAALACENLMLAIRAQGFDTCPMEGFDESRVGRVLNLKCGSRVVMVISIGERDPQGIWGEQIRLPKERFFKTI